MTARALILAALLVPAAAAASSGVLSGRILFYQNQGNFCPGNRDCTGATYLQSQFNTDQPVVNTKVFVRDAAGAVIGQGSTDGNGRFTISWFRSGAGSIQGNFIWTGEHRDGRFNIRAASGGRLIFWTPNFQLVDGTTASRPQDSGGSVWGSRGAPNPAANIYEGAGRMWNYSLFYSNRMQNAFNGVEVRTFSTLCPTSCLLASGQIHLDPGAAFAPQARILHEMGHAASTRSHSNATYRYGGDYCFPSTGGNCAWNFNTAEWSAANFEEGIATFFGDVALYWSPARAPHSCLASAVACGNNSFNTETSSGAPGSTCASGENRFPLSVTRYLWDAYDGQADYPADTLSVPYADFFEGLNAFPDHRNNRGKDEPWSCFLGCWISDRDGRSAVDYVSNLSAARGWNTNPVWSANCSPVGD